jgi:hypothetical protein
MKLATDRRFSPQKYNGGRLVRYMQSFITYENKEHGFTFDYPATWHNQFDAYEAQFCSIFSSR